MSLLLLLLYSDSLKISTVQNPLGMNDAWRACEFTVNAEYKNQYVMLGTHMSKCFFRVAQQHTQTHTRKKNMIKKKTTGM